MKAGSKILLLVALACNAALLAGNAIATEYYFDSNAASAGNGTLSTPYKSLSSLPTLVSGDVVKLARGSHWEHATIPVADHVTIENYGDPAGPKPILDGSRLVSYSDSALNASETLQDPNDPAAGVITLHTTGVLVYGVFVNDEFPVYIGTEDSSAKPFDCTSAAASVRGTPRFSFANNTTKFCRASLPAGAIGEVRLVTRRRVIDLSLPADHSLRDAEKYIKISGLDIRNAEDAGVGGAQNVSGLNYGKIYIENNDFHRIINTSICLCISSVSSSEEYATKGDKFDKLKVNGNRFYEYGREAIYVGIANSSPSEDELPIEIVDNIFGEKPVPAPANPYLISGWNMNTSSGSEAVDIKKSNKRALVSRNVFLLNKKKKALFVQSYDVEITRNTINNPFVPVAPDAKPVDAQNSAIWHEFEAPLPPADPDGGGVVTENSISNGKGSGILFRGATGLEASLNSVGNQFFLEAAGSCSVCPGAPLGNSAFVIRGKTDYKFWASGNVARGGDFAIRRWEEVPIDPTTSGNTFRGESGDDYCKMPYLPVVSSALDSSECMTGTLDTDLDGVNDFDDMCPALATLTQTDTDGNGIGDECDLAWQTNDIDGDGVYNTDDSCPTVANAGQEDANDNGLGDACEHGLTASYFNDTDTTGVDGITEVDDKLVAPAALGRIDPNVDFNWGEDSVESGTVTFDYFSVRWTGRVSAPVTGTYTFCVLGDDGIRLWVNNIQLLDYWVPQDSETNCNTIALTANQLVPIKVEYFDLSEHALIQLTWSYPGQATQVVVPSSRLYVQ